MKLNVNKNWTVKPFSMLYEGGCHYTTQTVYAMVYKICSDKIPISGIKLS